jgi:hypothetical protein
MATVNQLVDGFNKGDVKANAITGGVVTLGKPVKETGSMFTFALQKGAAGWRIAGWSWAKS